MPDKPNESDSRANDLADRLSDVAQRIAQAAQDIGRQPQEVTLIAVSKAQPPERIAAALAAGHRTFGENRVQQALEHWYERRSHYPDLRLHLIGGLQRNKVRQAVELFDVIETVDRPKLVHALADEIAKQKRDIACLIQVNTGREPQKSGVLPEDFPALLTQARTQGLPVAGLMCIPPAGHAPAPHFAALADMASQAGLPTLSMGMSHDYAQAIHQGATHVRVGTAIFGDRPG
ncbi:MAG: YggS family pyridoxal phosphate-dependent enzyme [Pseudomonadota bacterium]